MQFKDWVLQDIETVRYSSSSLVTIILIDQCDMTWAQAWNMGNLYLHTESTWPCQYTVPCPGALIFWCTINGMELMVACFKIYFSSNYPVNLNNCTIVMAENAPGWLLIWYCWQYQTGIGLPHANVNTAIVTVWAAPVMARIRKPSLWGCSHSAMHRGGTVGGWGAEVP